jgi:thioredoxin 2
MTDTMTAGKRHVTLRCVFCDKLNRLDMNRAGERPACGGCGRPFLLDRPVKISGDDLDRIVGDADVPVLVDFYADWCGPCKVMAPLLDELAADRIGEVLVAKVDADAHPQITARLGIRGIPTLILFREAEEASRQTGAVPRSALDAMLEEM